MFKVKNRDTRTTPVLASLSNKVAEDMCISQENSPYLTKKPTRQGQSRIS